MLVVRSVAVHAFFFCLDSFTYFRYILSFLYFFIYSLFHLIAAGTFSLFWLQWPVFPSTRPPLHLLFLATGFSEFFSLTLFFHICWTFLTVCGPGELTTVFSEYRSTRPHPPSHADPQSSLIHQNLAIHRAYCPKGVLTDSRIASAWADLHRTFDTTALRTLTR